MSPGDLPEQAFATPRSLAQRARESDTPLRVRVTGWQSRREWPAMEARPLLRLSERFWNSGPDEGPAAA
jgi:hypothetical protein